MNLRSGILAFVLVALLLVLDSHYPVHAQVTEKDMDRMQAQITIIIAATTANQEAIMALDKRMSLSDQDQERMGRELELQGRLLTEIRDEAIRLRQSMYMIGAVFVLLMKSREIMAVLGKGMTVIADPEKKP